MKFEKIRALKDEKFRRLTGIKKSTFDRMIFILNTSIKTGRTLTGRKKKLSLEDTLLMTLEYMREYRTYFHISQSSGISESSAYKSIKWVEGTLN